MRVRPGKVLRVSEARTVDRLQMSCEHVGLELRSKTSETVSSAYNTMWVFSAPYTRRNRSGGITIVIKCV